MLERAKLGRFVLKKVTKSDDLENLTAAERARQAFEELGPSFVKFGQLLSTRPNLVPESFVEEFKKFHDSVTPVPFEEIRKILEEEYGGNYETVFADIDTVPLAAASIAQVHNARLKTGQEVVLKVQRPGIVDMIQQDLGVLYTIAGLLEHYVPESRPYNPQSIIDEFFKTLELETNFLIEANNIKRIALNFAGDPNIKVPEVYFEYCRPRILVMEHIHGIRLSDQKAIADAGINKEHIVSEGLRAFFKMVFRDGVFHGDLHAGNLFILPGDKIGVVDFGVVGRLSQRVRDAIANMFLALATEDYEMLAYEYIELAPYSDQVDFDQFTRQVRDLFAPFYGMSFKDVNFGKLLMDSTGIAARHRIVMPSELMLFFKALVTIEGMGRTIVKDFDILGFSMEFAQEIVKNKYDPQRVIKDLTTLGRDSTSFLMLLPRQLKQLLRKLNSKNFALEHKIAQLDDMRRSVEAKGNLLYLGFVISSLVIGGSLSLHLKNSATIYEQPVAAVVMFALAAITSLFAFYNYLR